MRHRPVAGEARDLVHEVAEQLRAIRRMHDFRMKLHGIELALFVRYRSKRCACRNGDHFETIWQPRHPVAVAHPHLLLVTGLPNTVEQRRRSRHLEVCPPELAVIAAFDAAAELLNHRLLAITDAKHRQTALEHPVRRPRCAHLGHARRPAGQYHRPRMQSLERLLRLVERHDFRVDASLSHTPSNELRDLAAEIDDEYVFCHGKPLRH